MRTTLCCPKCDYETPMKYEIGDVWCNTCECKVRSHDVAECQRDGCDIEVMDEAGVLREAKFWLHENHPDFCPNGYNPDDYEEHKYKGEEEMKTCWFNGKVIDYYWDEQNNCTVLKYLAVEE